MPGKRKTRKLNAKQEALLRKIHELFVQTGKWPMYRQVERALGFSMAPVVKDLRPELVSFYTPIGPSTACSLTLRGLATQPGAQNDLIHAFAAIRFIAGRASTEGLAARVSTDELQHDLGLTTAELTRVTEILSNPLDLHNAIGDRSSVSGESRVEFGVTEHSPDFLHVDSVDSFEAVNLAIAQKRQEESELHIHSWPKPRRRTSSKSLPVALPRHAESRYHRYVEEESRELLDGRHFREAVRAALQRFEFEVQKRSGLSDLTGKALMARAFGTKTPILKIKNADQHGSTEQEGYQFIAMGAMLALRNKYSHGRSVRVSQQEAEEQLAVVSYLLRRLDSATRAD